MIKSELPNTSDGLDDEGLALKRWHSHPKGTDKPATEEELRQTWKGKAPIVSNRLPSAFMNKKSSSNGSSGPRVKASSKKADRSISSKPEGDRRHKSRGPDSKSSSHRQRSVHDENRKPSNQKSRSMKEESSTVVDIMKSHSLKANGVERPRGKLKTVKPDYIPFLNNLKLEFPVIEKSAVLSQKVIKPLKLEEMITLGVVKSSNRSGPVKKMLHASSLKLYAIKEVPIVSKDARVKVQEWLDLWQEVLNDVENGVSIYGTFWNSPEGCVSIIMDNLMSFSLHNLLESVGAVPEFIIREIARKILKPIDRLHTIKKVQHGGIYPSQILFTHDGTIKLSFGLSSRIQTLNILNNILGEQAQYKNYFTCTPSELNGGNEDEDKESEGKKTCGMTQEDQGSRSRDIFDIGYMLLISALGGIEIVDLEKMYNEYQRYFDEKNQGEFSFAKLEKAPCCLVHFIEDYEKFYAESYKQKKLTLRYYLGKRFTAEFKDFLCRCLRFNREERPTARELRRHPFLSKSDTNNNRLKTPRLTLPEMLKINNTWGKNFQSEYSEQQIDRLCDALSVVLPFCEVDVTNENLKNSENIANVDLLAEELDSNPAHVFSKLKSVFRHVNSSQ